ncbi:abc multidrug transporter atrI [Hyphodiscus hymeniophilus]|uniref:Abc multidrug transporter atrI n=1 Tax=Hyphodiscus hymeniophilus TaxID=353542 RepID=A0A9P6VG48_9HELO|nr:abc multidrug transporter atrI [Hyphodiscus hymeniophilus]
MSISPLSASLRKNSLAAEEPEIQSIPAASTTHDPNEFDYHEDLTTIASQTSQAPGPSGFPASKTISNQDALEPPDPALDPTSSHFDVHVWAGNVLRSSDKSNVKFGRASFSFKNLTVSGSGSGVNFQSNVASVFMIPFRLNEYFNFGKRPEKKILSCFDGIIKPGELLLVLGRPGSGCSTLLKTMAGELHGLKVGKDSVVHYSGIPQKEMIRNFKGEIVYNSEVDYHFPFLTVKQTLEFAAAVRTPRNRIVSVSRKENIQRVTAVVMAICGLTRARNTRVGNDFVRGVSGGERKRVSIAEMILALAPVGSWDNATRGLDAATALQFVQTLRASAKIMGTTHSVAIYQASQAIYDVFDKVAVLYEGRQIYFGPTFAAKAFFEEMGWYCPPRQTTGDFLTAVTNHQARKPRSGYEMRVPRTPDDFEKYWRASPQYKALLHEIEKHEIETSSGPSATEFKETRRAAQAHHTRRSSPYIVSIPMQLRICTRRAYQRLWNDKVSTLTVVIGQIIMALIVGSVFYGTPNNTNSFFARGSTLFFATLLNALIAVTEINGMYQQRPIVEKQASYAFCHPFAEALAGVLSDAPVKLTIATCFNLIIYFLAGLYPKPSQFFVFFLFTVLVRFTMSAMFRTVAAVTKTISQALAIAGVLVLAIVIYTGYTIPRPYMHPWFKWLNYINPLAYAFEALMVNEFHGRSFPCASIVPAYPNLSGATFICPVAGAVAGEIAVSGDAYMQTSFQYSYAHIWRNLGIVIGFWVFFLTTYLIATELNSSTTSVAEVLLFRRGHAPKNITEADAGCRENTPSDADEKVNSKQQFNLLQQRSVFTWRDILYDITIKDEPRRLLDHVTGWVRPGTLTALMGVSGAGKTTLLDVLAQRTSVGVITGDMLVNGKSLDPSFQRKTGYVQQQDLHLETSTVREALLFSAMLRQPKSVPKEDKCKYVEEVIDMLDMNDFAEAVVGTPGEGLNVEQRKRLTIGVELAAKPGLLLFLDEPTSGLDSESSWAIICLLRKLADSGQAILSTIHQPSSILFEEFDRLLFLAKGGRTVYFGDIGPNSRTLINYFESNGARICGKEENPAEYILENVSGVGGGKALDWPELWKASDECKMARIEQERIYHETEEMAAEDDGDDNFDEFAVPLSTQIRYTAIRVFQQYWRTPSYIWGKFMLGGISALLCHGLYCKEHSMNIQSSQRQSLIMLFCIQIFVFASTFAQLVISALPDAQTAGAVATLMFSLTMIFNGVFQPPQALPGFWIFMYRISPLTYIVDGIAATGLHGRPVQCAPNELQVFDPPSGLNCGAYLQPYLTKAPGQLLNPAASSQCKYCQITNADQFLATSAISWSTRWRNFGIGWSYIVFNVAMAMALYHTFRVNNWTWANSRKPLRQLFYRLKEGGHWVQALLVGYYNNRKKGDE